MNRSQKSFAAAVAIVVGLLSTAGVAVSADHGVEAHATQQQPAQQPSTGQPGTADGALVDDKDDDAADVALDRAAGCAVTHAPGCPAS